MPLYVWSATPPWFISAIRSITNAIVALLLLLLFWLSPHVDAQPQFDGTTLTLPDIQVGEDILSLTLALTDPISLVFQVDFQNISVVSEQTQAACIDPYFSFAQNQLIIPVLEVGDDRYQVFLDLIDAEQGLFQVDLTSPLLTTVSNAIAPAFTVWQEGSSISLEWGSPNDGVDGYLVWYTPYQSGEPVTVADIGDFTGTTNISAALPIGVDYCLAMTSFGPEGNSDFSPLFRFTNFEVPYAAYNTDDPTLPALFIQVREYNLFMMLLHDAAADKPYGAMMGNVNEGKSLVVAVHPDHGLLRRVTIGQFTYHFVNYTATTVDLIEIEVEGNTTVYPDLPLSNYAISVINTLIDAWEAPDPQMLIFETEVGVLRIEQGIRNLQSANVGVAIATLLNLEELIEERIKIVDSHIGDYSLSELFDTSSDAFQAAEEIEELAGTMLKCSDVPGINCALQTIHQPDAQDQIEANPEIILDSFDLTLNLFQTVQQLTEELNLDCVTIPDPIEQAECEDLQGHPEPGEQEALLSINGSLNDAIAEEIERLLQSRVILLQNRKFETDTLFQENQIGEYWTKFVFPEDRKDQIFGVEFIFADQELPFDLDDFEIFDDLPSNLEIQVFEGGQRVASTGGEPVPDGFIIRFSATPDMDVFRIQLNDEDQNPLGHVIAMEGEVDTTVRFASQSTFQNSRFGINIKLDIPTELENEQVYDFELISAQQNPPWAYGIPILLPSAMQRERIPGGFRVLSDEPIPDDFIFTLLVQDIDHQIIRIELTGAAHDTLGYVLATPGEVQTPSIWSDMSWPRTHTIHYNNGWDPGNLVIESNGTTTLTQVGPGTWQQDENGNTNLDFGGTNTIIIPPRHLGNGCVSGVSFNLFTTPGENADVCFDPVGIGALISDGRFFASVTSSAPGGGNASAAPISDTSASFFFGDTISQSTESDVHLEFFDDCDNSNELLLGGIVNTFEPVEISVRNLANGLVERFPIPSGGGEDIIEVTLDICD